MGMKPLAKQASFYLLPQRLPLQSLSLRPRRRTADAANQGKALVCMFVYVKERGRKRLILSKEKEYAFLTMWWLVLKAVSSETQLCNHCC